MAMVEFTWTMNIPNEFMVDHTFTDGKTVEKVYDGPDKLYLIINNETGLQESGPITQLEKDDGRPVGKDCRYVEVDCISNPLVCQLLGPVLDEEEEEYTGEAFPPGVRELPGHNKFSYQTPLQARDVYETLTIHVDKDDKITIPTVSIPQAVMGGGERVPDWPDVRAKRMQLLKNSDSEIVEDMPTELKTKWQNYRQALRDWPATMINAGIPAWAAYNMEPIGPANETPPDDTGLIID